jgi:hypothetical protein
MSDVLNRLRNVIQEDVGQRGLKTDPTRNLVNAFPDDFRNACLSLAQTPKPVLVIVSGFYIPTAQPPAGETDGPLGALFLARALTPLGVQLVIATDGFCIAALQAGLTACGLAATVPLVKLTPVVANKVTPGQYWDMVQQTVRSPITHLLAIERVGPSHTLESVQRQEAGAWGEAYLDFLHVVPPDHQDRCHTMRGRDITDMMSPAHWLFEETAEKTIVSIGIGDGGNEIGMGKIPWEVIHRNVPGGGLVACRVPTDHLIVCGVSNWGGYALAAGVAHLRGQRLPVDLFDAQTEKKLLQLMVDKGPLVDGVSGKATATVDGLDFDRYIAPLQTMGKILAETSAR